MEKQKINNTILIHRTLSTGINSDELSKKLSNFFVKIESIHDIQINVNNKLEISNEDPEGVFIKSIHNKLEDSYRSPISNEYYPLIDTYGKYPPQELRFIEVELGKLMKIYNKLYYGINAVSSVYAWELGESMLSGFGASVLISNEAEPYDDYSEEDNECSFAEKDNTKKCTKKNFINSINIFNVKFFSEVVKNVEYIKVSYKLNSTMIIGIESKEGVSIGSTISRNFEENHYINDISNSVFHIEKIGRMVEQAENILRLHTEEIDCKKFHEIITDTKPDPSINEQRRHLKAILDDKKIEEH